MHRGFGKVAVAALAFALGGVVAMEANAAGQGFTRGLAPPATTPAPGPAITPAAPVRPTLPVAPRTAKPDYAISIASQQELENTALQWRFRIDNKGNATPTGVSNTIPAPGGGSIKLPGATAAKLVVSLGNPCPNPTNWIPFAQVPIGLINPGASAILPAAPIQMPGDSVGKGCRFRAEIVGPAEDGNLANNVVHMISKTALLPDLVVVFGPDLGGPGGNLDVRNIGKAAAGPSTFRFDCTTKDQDKNCGKPWDPWKPSLTLDVAVPALNPGQTFTVKKSSPKGAGVSWKATADHLKQVTEGNEGNNVLTEGM